jgi:uncharacterized repeat protein (TIGR01451 family)
MRNPKNVLTNKRNNCRLFFRRTAFAIFGIMSLFSGQISAQQPAILGATDASNQAVVFPDANVPGTQNLVSGLPANSRPHGVAYYGSDNALISDFINSRVFVVQISTATLVSTITTSPGYDGTGTIAVAPNLTAALAMGNSVSLNVIQAPFGPGSTISQVVLPGAINSYQTQAIVFNNAGRAFVYHSTGISVLDAPYTSITFTIPVAGNASTGAIAISPNGNTLLTTTLSGNQVRIFQAPFSAASTSTNLTIPGGNNLDGIMVAPNGLRAIVVSASSRQAASIAAPFSTSSTVETLPLPAGGGTDGFEDVGISADSQIAILTGNSLTDPAVFVQAPFGATSVTSLVPIMGVANPARGAGAVRFLPPGLAPGLTISKSAPATVASGANLTYTISYSNTGTANATNVIIRDPLPAGTTFVSATNGGTLMGGNVVFNIGTVNAGAGTQTVSFTVTVNTAAGGTVDNNNYTIEGDGISPIPGPPVTTSVTAGQPTQVSQITPTGTTCSQFAAGTSATLNSLEYSLKPRANTVINNVSPGVFFYWVKVTAPAGSNTFTITEAITTGNFNSFFSIAKGSNVFNSSCVSLHPTITQSGNTITVTFNAPTAGAYFIAIKFDSQSLSGKPKPSPTTTVHYDISTMGVPGSTSGIDLKKKGT